MDLSKTRQHYRLASGGSLNSAPTKTDIDAKSGPLENGNDHIWRGDDSDGKGFSHPDYPKPSSRPTGA